MSIAMIQEGVRHVPIVFCEHCGDQIVKAEGASFCYQLEPPFDQQRIDFVHNDCVDLHQKGFGVGAVLGVVPLETFPVYLSRVLEIDLEDAVTTADYLSAV